MNSEKTDPGLPAWVHNRSTSRGLYAAMLVLFCFPFVEISCRQGKNGPVETHSRSGLQMALGGETTTTVTANTTTSRTTTTGQRSNPWMTVFGIALFAALAITVFAASGRDWAIAETVCAGLSLMSLLFQFVILDTYRSKLGQNSMAEHGSVEGRYTIWLYLTFLCSIASVVLSASRLRKPASDDEEVILLEEA